MKGAEKDAYTSKCPLWQERAISNKQLNDAFRALEKQKQSKPKTSARKLSIKSKAEINEIETKNKIKNKGVGVF